MKKVLHSKGGGGAGSSSSKVIRFSRRELSGAVL
ncbi:rCG59309 [Rattus norvegicus]|uniref:RCG59309 n=1 Tax=Rattus norvegicus TaxID=10116 RepID=A6K7R0_RAT|nr:rCG59309 [Rattus norvegicus]